jgi:hypothetical protein
MHKSSQVRYVLAAACTLFLPAISLGQGAPPAAVPDLTQPEFAQEKLSVLERPRPEYDPIGYQFGPYTVVPSLELGETFDSNILGSQNFERSDFFTTVKPAISLQSDWPTDAVSFYAEGDVRQYARYSSENVGNMTARGSGRLDIERGQTLSLEAGYQIAHEDRYSPESEAATGFAGGGAYAKYPTEYSLTTGRLNYVYSPSRLGFEVQASVDDFQYSNEPTLNGGLAINSDRSRAEFSLIPRVSYELTPGYQAFFEATGNRRQYDTTADASPEHYKRSSSGYGFAGGTQINLGDFLSAEGYVGFQDQDYDDSRLGTNSGVYFGASVLWNITTLTSIRFQGSRTIQETILTNSSGFWDTQIKATVEHEILRNLLITAAAGYDVSQYKGIAREDSIVSGDIGARWALTQTYSLDATAGIQHRFSNAINNSFTRALLAINLKASF